MRKPQSKGKGAGGVYNPAGKAEESTDGTIKNPMDRGNSHVIGSQRRALKNSLRGECRRRKTLHTSL
jgi:hypothetical protein